MQVSVIAIGNSRGIRLPKAVLDQLGVGDKLEMEIDAGRIILKPPRAKAREGWEAALRGMAASGDDAALLPEDGLLPEEAGNGDFEWEWS